MGFPNFSLLLIYNFIPLWSENILYINLILLNALWFVLRLGYFLFQRKFHVLLRRMSILLLGRVFCRCLLVSLGYGVFKSSVFLLNFFLIASSIIESALLKSPTIIVVYFSLHFGQFLLHAFWCSVIKSICTYNCYLLMY